MFRLINYVAFFAVLFCLIGCTDKKSSDVSYNSNTQVWADTIVYEVLISNPDTLNEWESLKVKNVRHKKLVDDLFNMIYSGEKKAYHYYEDKKLSIAEVKELEEDPRFYRNKLGKLQFTETWVYNPNTNELKKEIHSILLAYELYNEFNELRGYKAAFVIKGF